jgi:hypothetical protein
MTPGPANTSVHESRLQRIDKKTSSGSMLFGVIFFSFVAGMRIDSGILLYFHARAEYRWPAEFALGCLFLVVAIRWAFPLLRRAKAGHELSNDERPNDLQVPG